MSTAVIIVPSILFLIFVAPLWLILHYRSKKKTAGGLTSEDQDRLLALAAKSEQMGARIATLEKILDSESPSWRQRYE